MQKHTVHKAESTMPAGAKKDYAKFSLLITYTYPVAKKKGKPSQTYRDDLVKVNYENDGMKVEGLHPVELLHRKFLEERMGIYCAVIFDNSKPKSESVIFKVIIHEGKQTIYRDARKEYFDLETGMSFKHFLNESKLVA